MTKKLEVKHLASDYPKQGSITSMTEAFFGFKPGTLSARKLTVDDQEYKWGDERHREDRGNEAEETNAADEDNEK